jgi:uncharacterized protein (TIRG00374 family)
MEECPGNLNIGCYAKIIFSEMTFAQRIKWFFQSAAPDAQRARRITKLLILFALFSVLFVVVPFSDVVAAILNANPILLILGIALVLPGTYLTAVELAILVHKQGIQHGVNKVFAINLAVKFYNLVTPGTLVGSGMRWYRLAQPGSKTMEALAALAFFRLLETFLTIVFGFAFWLLGGEAARQYRLSWLLGLIIGSILFWFVLTRASKLLSARLNGYLNLHEFHPVWKGILTRVERFFLAITAYSDSSIWALSVAVLAGLVSMMIGVGSSLSLAVAVGIKLTFMQMGWIYALVLLITQLPFTIAGGLGVREASLVVLLPTMGIDPDLALAFSLLLFIRGVLLSIIGGLWEAVDALRSGRKG